MKALLIIAPENFRDEELFNTREELEKAGIETVIASTKVGECKGMLGGKANAVLSLDEVNVDDFDAIVFIGGAGTPIVRAHPRAKEIAKEAYEKGKVVAAICWAPTILALAGVLEGKKATCWVGYDPEFGKNTDEILKEHGAIFTGNPVEVDGKVVTANGPKAAHDFGRAIALLLKGA